MFDAVGAGIGSMLVMAYIAGWTMAAKRAAKRPKPEPPPSPPKIEVKAVDAAIMCDMIDNAARAAARVRRADKLYTAAERGAPITATWEDRSYPLALGLDTARAERSAALSCLWSAVDMMCSARVSGITQTVTQSQSESKEGSA